MGSGYFRTVMSDERYIYTEESLTDKEAREKRQENIDSQKEVIRRSKLRVKDEIQYLKKLKKLPLPKTRTVQTILRPGDPGYDEAPANFNPLAYCGKTEWRHNLGTDNK